MKTIVALLLATALAVQPVAAQVNPKAPETTTPGQCQHADVIGIIAISVVVTFAVHLAAAAVEYVTERAKAEKRFGRPVEHHCTWRPIEDKPAK